jgi:outer membrane protein assembly factor BamB
MRLPAGVVVATFIATATVSAQNWPSFRGPNASGVADGAPTATAWDAKTGKNILWKTPVAGVAVSSPIVWGDHVFVSTAVGSDPSAGIRTGLYGDVEPAKDDSKHTWKLAALDKRTGKLLWERVAH